MTNLSRYIAGAGITDVLLEGASKCTCPSPCKGKATPQCPVHGCGGKDSFCGVPAAREAIDA